MKGQVMDALKMYEQCGETERIKNLLIRNGRRHPGAGHYYELKDYYMALKEEDVEESEYCYGKLKEYAKTSKGGEKQEAQARLFIWISDFPIEEVLIFWICLKMLR